jgi:hypothetical protein
MATLTRDLSGQNQTPTNQVGRDRVREDGATARLLVALGAAVGAWQILTSPDPAKAAIQVLIATGVALLVAAVLFAREVIQLLRAPLYVALVAILAIWLVLAYGSTQWNWSLLPG